jgi:shikimate kinase
MKNIYLIGMPSSGKTSLGKLLAKRLDYQFLDMDAMIVECEKRSIADIFKENGEDYFRRIESQTLKQIQPDQGLVVSTGGGTPCFFDNMAFIRKSGLSVFLDVSPEELLKRIKSSKKNDRPLLNFQEDDQQLLESLKQKYYSRLSFYQQANYTVKGDRIQVDGIMEVIENEPLFS